MLTELDALGVSEFSVDFCAVGPNPPVGTLTIVSGTFALSNDDGTVSGTVDSGVIGPEEANPEPGILFLRPIEIFISITGGTGLFENAIGSAHIEGDILLPQSSQVVIRGQISGTFDASS